MVSLSGITTQWFPQWWPAVCLLIAPHYWGNLCGVCTRYTISGGPSLSQHAFIKDMKGECCCILTECNSRRVLKYPSVVSLASRRECRMGKEERMFMLGWLSCTLFTCIYWLCCIFLYLFFNLIVFFIALSSYLLLGTVYIWMLCIIELYLTCIGDCIIGRISETRQHSMMRNSTEEEFLNTFSVLF